MVGPFRLVLEKNAFGNGLYMPFRELWGYELLFYLKKCFCETPYWLLVVAGCRWLSMVMDGCQWLLMAVNGCHWSLLVVDGFHWLSMSVLISV